MKIKILKSDKTIKKEEKQAKIEQLKTKKNVTNEELKELLLAIYEEIKQ